MLFCIFHFRNTNCLEYSNNSIDSILLSQLARQKWLKVFENPSKISIIVIYPLFCLHLLFVFFNERKYVSLPPKCVIHVTKIILNQNCVFDERKYEMKPNQVTCCLFIRKISINDLLYKLVILICRKLTIFCKIICI